MDTTSKEMNARLAKVERDSVPIRYFKAVQDPEGPASTYMVESHDGQFVSRSIVDALQRENVELKQKRQEAEDMTVRYVERLHKTERELAAVRAERDKYNYMYHRQVDYGVKLQRLIENLKYDSEPPYPELHHHKMIVKAKHEAQRLRVLVQEIVEADDIADEERVSDKTIQVSQLWLDEAEQALAHEKESGEGGRMMENKVPPCNCGWLANPYQWTHKPNCANPRHWERIWSLSPFDEAHRKGAREAREGR